MKTVFADTSGFYAAMDAVRDFERGLLRLREVSFVDAQLHAAGIQRCLAANRRHLSLTDSVSLEWMNERQVAEARDGSAALEAAVSQV